MKSSVNRKHKSLIKSVLALNHKLISFRIIALTLSIQPDFITQTTLSLSDKKKKHYSNVCKAMVNGKSSSVHSTS